MPKHLGKLVEVFDTPEDPTLSLKRSSTKISAKVTMALAMSHGEKVNCDKVRASLAKDSRKGVSMRAFMVEARKYAQKMTTLILLEGASSTSIAPSSSTTPTTSTTPTELS
jgi:hypothetical protein